MKDVLHEIAIKLKKGEFKNESEISRGVVLRILSQLGWNHFDTSEISSEYSLGGRRVDYALFCGKKRPIVFIEVKQPGNTENADRQLFEYAFHEGIPLAVLTDGVTWSFYLPGEQGSYEDRRVYKLDLIERSAEEAVEKLIRYLRKDRIKTGDALTDARSDYNNKSRLKEAKEAIPEAWEELVCSEDDFLLELLSKSVEKKCGVKPNRKDLICFFQGILDSQLVHHTPQIKYEFTQTKNRENIGSSSTSPEGRFYRVNGKNFSARSAKDVVIGILIEMQKIDPSFFEKCYNHDANRGRSRTFIGKSPKELYTNRPDLEDCNYRLAKGWYLMTNFNNQVKRSIISMALDVMGYKLGREVDYKLEK